MADVDVGIVGRRGGGTAIGVGGRPQPDRIGRGLPEQLVALGDELLGPPPPERRRKGESAASR